MDLELCRALIERHFPEIKMESIEISTRGWDSIGVDVNDDLMFRFPRRDDVVVYQQREVKILPLLEIWLPISVPHFTYFSQSDEQYPYQFIGYKKIRGTFLEDEGISEEQLYTIAPELAHFLSVLHRFPIERAVEAGVEMHTPEQWREMYTQRYHRELVGRVFPRLNAELRAKSEQVWQGFLENTALFTFESALIHCDLASEHILCEPETGQVNGVIDWGDVTIGDPAIDFVGLYERGGREFVQHVIAHYHGKIDASFWQRIAFYLQYPAFSQLMYGSYGNEEIFAQGLAALRALRIDADVSQE